MQSLRLMQSQSLRQIFKVSTHIFAVKSLLSTKTYINLTYHLYIITLVNITTTPESLLLQVLLTLQDPLQDLLSLLSSFPFVHTTLHYL